MSTSFQATVSLTNTQTADIDAYGNLFTPFKYNKFYKGSITLAEYVETVGYYTACALTLGQKTGNNLFSGPG